MTNIYDSRRAKSTEWDRDVLANNVQDLRWPINNTRGSTIFQINSPGWPHTRPWPGSITWASPPPTCKPWTRGSRPAPTSSTASEVSQTPPNMRRRKIRVCSQYSALVNLCRIHIWLRNREVLLAIVDYWAIRVIATSLHQAAPHSRGSCEYYCKSVFYCRTHSGGRESRRGPAVETRGPRRQETWQTGRGEEWCHWLLSRTKW